RPAPAAGVCPVTLRLKLMIGLVLLTALGLVVLSVASTLALRAYMLDRTDRQLEGAQELGSAPLLGLLDTMPNLGLNGLERAITPTDYVLELRRPNGEVLRVAGSSNSDVPAAPLLDSVADLDQRAADGGPFTVSVDGQQFRAVVEDRTANGRVTASLLALPLAPVQETVRQMVVVAAAASAAVLAATAVLAWLFLTRGLRPLEVVTATASAIAAGDLSRRVPEGPSRSETGRLGRALNAMLGQIQAAFAARVASQEQLRRFVADASHELRTPLTSIRGYVDLMRAGMVSPDDVDDALRRLHDESVRMGSLVDDMLYLAHLDEKRPLDRIEVDLTAVVVDSANDFRAVAPERPFAVEVPEAAVVVVGDGGALRQLVANLLANARVHTPAATPVAIRLSRIGSQAVVEVADRGQGIPEEVASRVFDRFYRASGGRERGAGGSGLGLAIVAACAEAHDGRAQVFSTPGEGTTFRVTLPASASASPTSDERWD
nr:HAMP domain-containing sensor histidine kinase [Micromonospora sp. DSM 115978]